MMYITQEYSGPPNQWADDRGYDNLLDATKRANLLHLFNGGYKRVISSKTQEVLYTVHN